MITEHIHKNRNIDIYVGKHELFLFIHFSLCINEKWKEIINKKFDEFLTLLYLRVKKK